MLLLRISLVLCLLSLLAGYPAKVQDKSAINPRLDPADYPDLTNGLSDSEVESTLNGLSLDDLHALNKLLDDAGTGPLDLEASLREHHRQAKKHYDDMDGVDDEFDSSISSAKQLFDDGCRDEDEEKEKEKECTQRPKCNKRPTCPTIRCTAYKKKSTCKSHDDFMDVNIDPGFRKVKYRKSNTKIEQCDPEDTMCLQRSRENTKQRINLPDFSDITLNQDYGNIDNLEQLAVETPQDQALKLNKHAEGWNVNDEFNTDYNKAPNVADTANMKGFKELPQLNKDWADSKLAGDTAHPEQEETKRNEETAKQLVMELPYERHQLARVAHEQAEQDEKIDEDKMTGELNVPALENDMQINAPPAVPQEGEIDELETAELMPLAKNMAANEGDSFIAKNLREPLRYLIETDDGYIKSGDEHGENRLRTNKQQSEMLNISHLDSSVNAGQEQQESQYKRYKRNSKKSDDAPENTNESYLKKLMDSFPRDQSNLKVAIRQSKRAHLRVKRFRFNYSIC